MIIARTENVTFHQGDSREVLKTIPDESFNTVVTSPPYWGLRDYGLPPAVWSGDATCVHEFGEETLHRNRFGLDNGISDKQKSNSGNAFEINQGSFCVRCGAWLGTLGLEPTPDLYVAHLVEIFEQVWRVLRDDGTAWLNLGDSYVGSMKGWSPNGHSYGGDKQKTNIGSMGLPPTKRVDGLKPKDLVGIPWRVAFALQAAGWYLRSDIIWHKPNPMPESVRDRPTKAHEYVFLLSKSPKYYYDADAIAEPAIHSGRVVSYDDTQKNTGHQNITYPGQRGARDITVGDTRNRRTVWTIPTQPFSGWTETVRRVRVAWDEISCDTKRITSPDCPLHADSTAQVANGEHGEHEAYGLSRSARSNSYREQALCGDSFPTEQHPCDCSDAGNSDSLRQQCSPSATDHNSEIHKRGRDPSTSAPYKPCAGIESHNSGKLMSPSFVAPDENTDESNILQDATDAHSQGQILNRIAGKFSLEVLKEKCSCSFYKDIAEKTSHFATFPEKLVEPCILAGAPEGGTVLDPFGGSGTVGLVATNLGLNAVLIEAKMEYCLMAVQRVMRKSKEPTQ